MADVTALARKFKIDIDTESDPSTPVWSPLTGVTDFNPKIDPTKQDATTYDTDGWGAQEKTSQQWTAEITFLRRKDATSGAYPVAQETLRGAQLGFGAAARAHVRWYDRDGGPEAYEGTGLVTWERANSGVTDLDAAKVTLDGDGALTPISNPASVSSLAVTPNPASVASGDIVALTATATLADSSTQDVTAKATWSTSDPAVASVSGGFVTGVAPGSADITAAYAGKTATDTVTVS